MVAGDIKEFLDYTFCTIFFMIYLCFILYEPQLLYYRNFYLRTINYSFYVYDPLFHCWLRLLSWKFAYAKHYLTNCSMSACGGSGTFVLEIPKSQTLIRHYASTSRLAGLMSRCMMLALCMKLRQQSELYRMMITWSMSSYSRSYASKSVRKLLLKCSITIITYCTGLSALEYMLDVRTSKMAGV